MKCQVCEGDLKDKEIEGVAIIKCDKCKGFWVHGGDLNKLIKHKRGDVEKSSIDHHFHQDSHSSLKCHYCEDSAMRKINFINYSDIIMDYCEDCGSFWIDGNELEKMQKYIDELEKNDKDTIVEIVMNFIYSLPKV